MNFNGPKGTLSDLIEITSTNDINVSCDVTALWMQHEKKIITKKQLKHTVPSLVKTQHTEVP